MRPHTLALSTILSLAPSSWAFAPMLHTSVSPRSTSSLSLKQSDIDAGIEQAKKGVFSVFAASTIFIASSTMGQQSSLSFVEPAFAATTAAPATTKSAKPVVVDPLASEKAALETAKAQLATASAESAKAKKVLSDANTAYSKASDAASAAEKKVVNAKKALIAANDKLADAKSKQGKNGGDVKFLKEVEDLAAKVGEFQFLWSKFY